MASNNKFFDNFVSKTKIYMIIIAILLIVLCVIKPVCIIPAILIYVAIFKLFYFTTVFDRIFYFITFCTRLLAAVWWPLFRKWAVTLWLKSPLMMWVPSAWCWKRLLHTWQRKIKKKKGVSIHALSLQKRRTRGTCQCPLFQCLWVWRIKRKIKTPLHFYHRYSNKQLLRN